MAEIIKKSGAGKTPARNTKKIAQSNKAGNNKRHAAVYSHVHQWLVDNKAPQKLINTWEKDEPKLNKFIKAQEKKMQAKKFKDPNAPKRPLSAYMVFCNQNREKVKRENPKIEVTEIMKKLGEGWKALSEKQRTPYKKEAALLKEKYEKEMESYVPPEGFPLKKVDKDKPKKPLTNYIFFCSEKRPEVVAKNPGMKATEVLSRLGEMWKALPEKNRETYNKKAAKAKIDYQKAVEAYNKKKGIKNEKPAKAAEKKKPKSKKAPGLEVVEEEVLSESNEE